MRAVPLVLIATTLSLPVVGAAPAYAVPTCGGLPVTIDLNRADHPWPDRPQSDVVLGTPRKDSISTGAGDDVVCSGIRGDFVDLGKGDDRAFAGHGRDYLTGGRGDDVLRGGTGHDRISYVAADRPTSVDLGLEGPQRTGSGRDSLDSVEGVRGSQWSANRLSGDADDNWFMGGYGQDRIEGRGGADDIYTSSTEGGEIFGGPGSDLIYGEDGDDLVAGGDGNDFVFANGGVDVLRGGAGDDELMPGDAIPSAGLDRAYGGVGSDVLLAAQYDELLAGGPGRDRVSYQHLHVHHHVGEGVLVDLAVEGPQDTRIAGLDELLSIEDLTGSQYDDELLGDGLDNLLQGGPGNDWMDGRDGADTCEGASGEDEFVACETTIE